MSFIGQVCLHIRGICYSDKAPQCNRMTATGQDTDNKRTIYKYTNILVDRTQSFRTSEQLFVCYGGQQKGNAVSKQRMAHWTVDAITLAYEAQGVPCPLRLHAHSTRGVASSWALARGASLADICRAAGWATPNTFARFYSLRVEPVCSCVLTSNG